MSRDVLDLGARAWQFGQVPRRPFSTQPHDDLASVTGWLPGRVPGDVRADLLAAGRIPSLDTPEDLASSRWVDEVDWWYRTEIDASEAPHQAVLEADGIDYLSAIYLDGALLATHEGMFARQRIVLPSLAPGKHDLAVRVWGAGALPHLPNSPFRRTVRQLLVRLGLTPEYFPDRMATPKAQFSFGWDFAPRVLSTGIWDEIRLVRCRSAYLASTHIVPEPLTVGDDPTPVRWHVRLRVLRFTGEALHAVVELADDRGETVHLAQERFELGRGEDVSFSFDSPPLARWWPWDQGEPRLYRLVVRLVDDYGVADEVETAVGVRIVRRERFPNGAPWRFTINGRSVFLRGANWVPADVLPGRVTDGYYAGLIGLARSAGINFLRIWGGGIREKRAFWEQCNRLGMLAMQEFPLACAFLDHYSRDPLYLSVLRSEAIGFVESLRNHPSLIAWCGGNEINPRRERIPLRTIEDVLQSEDSSRPWIPASPSEGDVHDWDVWHGSAPWQSLAEVRAPFMSEFGLQAMPVEATVRGMFPDGVPTSLSDKRWVARKLQASKLLHYAGPSEGNLVATIEATQRAQAAGLQAGIEGCRLRREGSGHRRPCGGVAFWQWNEPWPVVSWSVIDRNRQPKAAFEMLTGSYQPLLVAARFKRRAWKAGEHFQAEVWLVNDRPSGLEGCIVEARLDGQAVQEWKGIEVLPASASPVGAFEFRLAAPPAFLELSCLQRAAVVARNRYDLAVYLPPPQPPGAWLKRRLADLLLR